MIDMNKYKKALIIIGILIAINVALLGGTAFSYLITLDTNGGSNVTINTPSNYYDWQSSGTDELSIYIDAKELSILDASNNGDSYIEGNIAYEAYGFDTSLLANDKEYYCNYSLYYEPTVAYSKTQGAITNNLKEFTIKGTGTDYYTNAVLEFEKEINGDSRVLLYSGTVQGIKEIEKSEHDWEMSLRFYGLSIDQESALGQKPSGKVVAEINDCGSTDRVCIQNVPDNNTCSVSSVPNIDSTTCDKIAAFDLRYSDGFEYSCNGNIYHMYYPNYDSTYEYEIYKSGDFYYYIEDATYNNGIITADFASGSPYIHFYDVNNNGYLTINYNNQMEGASPYIRGYDNYYLESGEHTITIPLRNLDTLSFRVNESEYTGSLTYSLSTCSDVCNITKVGYTSAY